MQDVYVCKMAMATLYLVSSFGLGGTPCELLAHGPRAQVEVGPDCIVSDCVVSDCVVSDGIASDRRASDGKVSECIVSDGIASV